MVISSIDPSASLISPGYHTEVNGIMRDNKPGLLSELRTPANRLAIILTLLSVAISAAVSYYFYQKDSRAAAIAFWIDTVKIVDAKSMGAAPLSVTDAAGKRIEGNIYASNVTFWNSGNANLRKEDVRQPFSIALGGVGTRLIDIQPTYFANGNEDHMAVSHAGVFSWDNLDPGEGIKARVIFTTEGEPSVTVTGHAPGAALTPANARLSQAVRLNMSIDRKSAVHTLPILVLLMMVLTFGQLIWRSDTSEAKKVMKQLGVFLTILFLSYFLGILASPSFIRPPF